MLICRYMKNKKIGSNQYKTKYKTPLTGKIDKVIVIGLVVYGFLLIFTKSQAYAKNMAVDNWLGSHTYLNTQAVYLKGEIAPTAGLIDEDVLEPTKPNIVSYIMEVFGKYGTDVGVQAILCFYSESGLRTEAYNFNNNGTDDRGIAQVNSIHGYNPKDLYDFRKNIDAAEQIYIRAGKTFTPWYGEMCN